MILINKILFAKILKGYTGITLWPFIILQNGIGEMGKRKFAVLINHERIHLRQQIECLVLLFYILYGYYYLRNRIRGMNHLSAYSNIPFEKESYIYEKDITYLKRRGFWGWRRFC